MSAPVTLDLGTIITGLIGALIIYFIKENTSEKKELKNSIQNLREQVIILQTEVKPIKDAVQDVPLLKAEREKMNKDLIEYFKEVKKIRGILSDRGIDLKDQ